MPTVRDYIQAKAVEFDLTPANVRYVLGNLAIAKVVATSEVTATSRKLADKAVASVVSRKSAPAASAHKPDIDALEALAAALDAVELEPSADNEATAAGERPLAATLKNFITAYFKVQSADKQLIEHVAKQMGVRISVFDRTTPRKDPLSARFHVPLVRIDSAAPGPIHYTTLFLLGSTSYVSVWFGNSEHPESGSSLRMLGIGNTPGTVNADAINSLGGLLKQLIGLHKYSVQHVSATPAAHAAPKSDASLPEGAIQHDRHGDKVPDTGLTPGFMDVKHGQFIKPGASQPESKAPSTGLTPGFMDVKHGQLHQPAHAATASAQIVSVRDYVVAQASSLGLAKKDVTYVMKNLETARIPGEAVASDLFQGLADRALQSLAKKIKRDKDAEEKQKAAFEENRPSKRPFGTNDSMLEEQKDPFTGEKLRVVYLLGDRKALMNEHSKVVYPIPDLSKVEGKDEA